MLNINQLPRSKTDAEEPWKRCTRPRASSRRSLFPMPQMLDPGLHLRRRPILEQPLREWLAGAADREGPVLVAAGLWGQLGAVRDLLIKLEENAAGVGDKKTGVGDRGWRAPG